jgi:tetratricopeptide (TPR) repeat protein
VVFGLWSARAAEESTLPYADGPVFGPTPPPTAQEASIIAQEEPPSEVAPALTPERRNRQLLYLYARLNHPAGAEKLAREVLAKNPGDRETLLALGSMYLERKDARRLRLMAKRVLDHYPNDDQALFFLASAFSLEGQHAEAEAILRRLRADQFRNKPYPYLLDLASEARRAGHWHESILAYRELLEDNQLSLDLRAEARQVLDELYRENLPQLHPSVNWEILSNTGSIVRSQLRYEHPVTTRHRLLVDVRRDDLSQWENAFVRGVQDSRMQGIVAVETRITQPWHMLLGIGGSTAGPVATGGFRHKLAGDEGEVRFAANYNARALDSLALEILDGRQSDVRAILQYRMDAETGARCEIYGRQVTAQDETLGYGWGLLPGIDYVALRKPIEVVIGYQGNVAFFDTTSNDTSLVAPLIQPGLSPIAALDASEGLTLTQSPDGLIASVINRHNFVFSLRGRIMKQWRWQVDGFAGYAFDVIDAEYGATLRTTFEIRKSLEFELGAGWRNSGSNSNSSSSVTELSMAMHAYF